MQLEASINLRGLVSSFFQAYNSHDFGVIAELISDDYEQHCPGVPSDRNAFFVYLATAYTKAPDGIYQVHDVICEGRKAAIRWSFAATRSCADANTGTESDDDVISISGVDIWEINEKMQISKIWFCSTRHT